MKLISSTNLAALSTLIVYVAAADNAVSKIEQAHQKILSNLSTRKSLSFGRHLVTDQCLNYQYEIDMTGINEQVMLLDEDFMGACDVELDGSGIYLACDYGRYDSIIDTMECSDVGGDILLFDFEMECDGIHAYYYNIPQCIHSTCDNREYADFIAQDMEEHEWEEYGLQDCGIDFTFIDYANDVEEQFSDVEYDDEYDYDEEKYEDDEVEYQDQVSMSDDDEGPGWEDDNLLVATAAAPNSVEGDSSGATLFGDSSVLISKVALSGTFLIAILLL